MPEILPNWHPIFVHFTIGLLVPAAGLLFVAAIFPSRSWSGRCLVAARWNLWIGAVVTAGTGAAGLYAFATVAHDAQGHIAISDHRNWAFGTALVWWSLALWAVRRRRAEGRPSGAFLALAAAGVIGLLVTGWKGGELVFRHGMGVLAWPVGAERDHEH